MPAVTASYLIESWIELGDARAETTFAERKEGVGL
jgi:hypothetical protein